MENKNKLDWSKIGVAVSTYSSQDTPETRIEVIEKCLGSVHKSVEPDCVKIIVNDASTNKRHLEVLERHTSDFYIIDNAQNEGSASGKNKSIRRMYEMGCEYMFLLDDDVEVSSGWAEMYVNAIKKTGVQHFQFAGHNRKGRSKSFIIKKGIKIFTFPGKRGCLLTLTRECVEKVGYFKILPHRYGHAHGHYSWRMNRAGLSGTGSMDVCESLRFVKYCGKVKADNYKKDWKKVQKNGTLAYKDKRIYIPYEAKD